MSIPLNNIIQILAKPVVCKVHRFVDASKQRPLGEKFTKIIQNLRDISMVTMVHAQILIGIPKITTSPRVNFKKQQASCTTDSPGLPLRLRLWLHSDSSGFKTKSLLQLATKGGNATTKLLTPGFDERLEPTNQYKSPMKRKENDLNQTSVRTCPMLIFR